jgi:hypothetical protein
MRLKNIAIRLSYIVYCNIQIYFVNDRFHNKALKGIVLSVSCSCAPNLLNICTFTPHIRQTLVTFPVMQFSPQLVHLVKICKFRFL